MGELSTDYLSGLGLSGYGTKSSTGTTETSATDTKSNDQLGQSDFLKLMVTQLNNQDPTNPTDNAEFISQMAQFSTVTGIEELSSSFETLSQSLTQGQTLQAASLVGKDVLVPADTATLSEGQGASGAVNLEASAGKVTVDIYNAGGQLVHTIDLGGLDAGLQEFDWDGLLDDGTKAPAGNYQFKINAQTDGNTEALTTLLNGEVQSVATDSTNGGFKLSVQGLGNIDFSDVYRIG